VSEISFQDIEKLDCESRYEIFLEMVAEERVLKKTISNTYQFGRIQILLGIIEIVRVKN